MKGMDNFQFEMTSRGREDLKVALQLITNHHQSDRVYIEGVSSWEIRGDSLMLMQFEKEPKFPFHAAGAFLLEFIWAWLEFVTYTDPPRNFDGDYSKGWSVLAGSGCPDNVLFRVTPVWALHHK